LEPGGVAQVVDHLLCEVQSLEFKTQSHQKKKKKTTQKTKTKPVDREF
jgi:hypothetical protein